MNTILVSGITIWTTFLNDHASYHSQPMLTVQSEPFSKGSRHNKNNLWIRGKKEKKAGGGLCNAQLRNAFVFILKASLGFIITRKHCGK